MADLPAGFVPDQIPETALVWHRAGRGAALATVIETWGSAPRQAGSQLVVSNSGEMMGSVSGGCVEGAVVLEAQASLADGKVRDLSFGVADDTAFAVGLACGGTIRILVEPVGEGNAALPAALLAELVDVRAARRPVAMAVNLQTHARRLLRPGQDAALDARFRADRSGMEGAEFVAIHNAPLRLIVVGAVHVAQPLLAMARLMGFDTDLIDPRAAFGSAARFPDHRVIEDWPDAAIAALAPDARSAVVTLAHDPKIDDPAIVASLGSPAFYLGCLGSGRTHAKRLERLAALGLAPDALSRLHAPVGLAIGAKTPAEIAVSILAQIVAVLRQG